jgi:hypothetical protein
VRSPTRLEFAEEIQSAILARRAELAGQTLPHPARDPERPERKATIAEPAVRSVEPFRPSLRPPIAVLVAFDDGSDEGQSVRLRGDRFVIGRSEGDLLIPHDGQVSARHAELVRRKDEDSAWVWTLTDLGSTNGSFVRAGVALLKEGQEFLVGRTRYRFEGGEGEAPAEPASQEARPPETAKSTIAYISSASAPVPTIIELTPSGPGGRVPLLEAEYWIGSDRAACLISPAHDPFVSPRHARLSRDAKGRWHVHNNKSANGVWVRVEQMDLTGSCYFQLGEQRFAFKVPRP